MSIRLDELGRAVKQLQSRHHRMFEARLADIGSSLAQWDALRAIQRNPGASSHALAEYTFQTDQSFGALAARLVEKGLVIRSAGKGRVVSYSLTRSGAATMQRGSDLTDQVLAETFEPLNAAEREQLFRLLTRLIDHVER